MLYYKTSSLPDKIKDISVKFEDQTLGSKKYKDSTIYGNPGGLDWLRKRIELEKKLDDQVEELRDQVK
jgi:hypothetical protein